MQLSWRWKRAQRPLVALLPWKSPSQQRSEQSQRSLFSTMDSTRRELHPRTETIACWLWSERFPPAITWTPPGSRSHKVSHQRSGQTTCCSSWPQWGGDVCEPDAAQCSVTWCYTLTVFSFGDIRTVSYLRKRKMRRTLWDSHIVSKENQISYFLLSSWSILILYWRKSANTVVCKYYSAD